MECINFGAYAGPPDVRLRFGGQSFGVHRSILASRSDYFKAMFTGGFMESHQTEITIHETSVRLFEKLLASVYDSTEISRLPLRTADDVSAAFRLCVLADKYLLTALKARVIEKIITVFASADDEGREQRLTSTLSLFAKHLDETTLSPYYDRIANLIPRQHIAFDALLCPEHELCEAHPNLVMKITQVYLINL
ncbi:BTB/POZ and MATH domain-containing protein 6 [Sphaceloma murrayae]|uniref:BTB/POZ and MATH domain-containing protein 6 n=1 Tax=Sphaceloma murrayae TaxID=2082308 RepID=A0A2K1QMW1_9PEZI|nr:BTB/POZ and MATH domain-containing protein 6 [Sphaceloma murrayae]